jgi:endonuclease/exonuclease/phosphatase family metal-dependent hydrolase
MSATFRAATFNMENLFSRAKVLNLDDKSVTSAILDDVAKLEKLLGKTTYSPADKTEILSLTKSLGKYIEIREDKGKLFSGTGANQKVSASGSEAWDGTVEFKRADISEMARESTGEVVKAVKADVLCTVEVESRGILQDFNSQALGSKKFKYPMLIDGNDPRGIDVGLLSRFEIAGLRTHIFDRDQTGVVFSRDCLQTELKLPDGRSLHILCNHLKSQGYGSPASNDAKRKRQAARIAQILSRYNLATDLVIVAGDMNDDPSSAALQPMLSVNNLFDVLELKFGNNAQNRWTYKYSNQLNQIDFLLASKPLKNGFQDAGIERRGMFGVAGVTPFPSVTSKTTSASDHAAVWAEFTV